MNPKHSFREGLAADLGIDPEIVKFLEERHVMTLATCAQGEPWCASLFYAFEPNEGCFVFLSDPKTMHVVSLREQSRVAGNVFLETIDVREICGVQIQGRAAELNVEDEDSMLLRDLYFSRFPFARPLFEQSHARIYCLRADLLKMTDNRVSFGFKRMWRRE